MSRGTTLRQDTAHAEFTRRLPNDSPPCTTAKPWFVQQLRTIAHAVQDAAEQYVLA
ncbi:hypothetical protein [Streptomyces fagopyri]|uniref:hypothetical protein n=1 Tax=Streptomyces fagopyri TaxID=2662397 RepID=UPI0012932379|nr:hypothetical protein [Streptomyces fagopyri]